MRGREIEKRKVHVQTFEKSAFSMSKASLTTETPALATTPWTGPNVSSISLKVDLTFSVFPTSHCHALTLTPCFLARSAATSWASLALLKMMATLAEALARVSEMASPIPAWECQRGAERGGLTRKEEKKEMGSDIPLLPPVTMMVEPEKSTIGGISGSVRVTESNDDVLTRDGHCG